MIKKMLTLIFSLMLLGTLSSSVPDAESANHIKDMHNTLVQLQKNFNLSVDSDNFVSNWMYIDKMVINCIVYGSPASDTIGYGNLMDNLVSEALKNAKPEEIAFIYGRAADSFRNTFAVLTDYYEQASHTDCYGKEVSGESNVRYIKNPLVFSYRAKKYLKIIEKCKKYSEKAANEARYSSDREVYNDMSGECEKIISFVRANYVNLDFRVLN